jgi:hypothetical protein
MNDERDPILDACLDEVLAGRRPPDLTARILQAYAARGAAGARPGNDASLPLPGPPIANGAEVPAPPVIAVSSNGRPLAAAPDNGQPVVSLRTSVGRPSRRNSSFDYKHAAVAATILGLAVISAVYVATQPPRIAKNNKPAKAPDRAVVKDNSTVPQPGPIVKPHDNGSMPIKPVDPPQIVQTPSSSGNSGTQIVDNGSPPVKPVISIPQPDYGDPSPEAEVISCVNAELEQSWVENGVKPAEARRSPADR